MTNQKPEPQTCWLALGVFYDPACLRDALAELTAYGFETDRLCVARFPTSRQWENRRLEDNDPFGRLFSDVQELQGAHEGVRCLFSAGALFQQLLQTASVNGDNQLPCPAWMTKAQCAHLTAHLNRGAAALIIRSENPAEQDVSSRILLRHSRHIVWTYDFLHTIADSTPAAEPSNTS